MPASIPPSRCARHNLVVPPGGRCVVCRRELSAVVVAEPVEPTSSALPWLLGILLVVGAGGAAAFKTIESRRSGSPPQAAIALTPIDKPKPVAKPATDELGDSLRMLEQAEAERKALERAMTERDEQERAAAAAQRKREELERDAKRHAEVKRDLDALALASARRSVTITMYSTTWCAVCTKARAYMEQKQISFVELDVDRDAAARTRAHVLNPRGSVPTIAVDDEVLIGFSPESLETRITRAAKKRTGS